MTGIIVYVSRTTFGNPTHINISENNPNIQKFLHTQKNNTDFHEMFAIWNKYSNIPCFNS